jgi:lipoprotein-anchoring transpeptidase ErfK/SrfK
MSKQANYPTRRAFVSLIPGALALSGCVTTQSQPRYTGPAYRVVEYQSGQKPGTIIVDPGNHFLYSVQDAGQALQYDRRVKPVMSAPGRAKLKMNP